MIGRRRNAWKGAGLPFGAVFWLVGDETVVPLLGLSRQATSYSVSVHVYALMSHFVFGATAESVRRQLRARL
jgi:putative membrane protein